MRLHSTLGMKHLGARTVISDCNIKTNSGEKFCRKAAKARGVILTPPWCRFGGGTLELISRYALLVGVLWRSLSARFSAHE